LELLVVNYARANSHNRRLPFIAPVGVAVASFSLLWESSRLTEEPIATPQDDQPNQPIDQSVRPTQPSVYEWEESFSNEKDIGRPRKNKVEIRCVNRNYQAEAEIEFYSLSERRDWTRKQSLRFENLNYAGCDPQFSDFNNDGLKDLTFISGQAARGANEIRTLLIYDPKKDELIHVKNSAEYPNLAYNKRLNCIDAWALHGATTTIFLRLAGDMLREFASVDTGAERIVTITRRSGERVVIRREPMHQDEVYSKYSTFDPPS
jgi:hypothetical protein